MPESNNYSRRGSCASPRFLLLAGVAVLTLGCDVPYYRPLGQGIRYDLQEPKTKRKFFLYLPADYDTNKSWPVVMTFHGMRPFDISRWQLREWQATADKYGLIVVAPDLTNSDLFMKFRLGEVTPSVEGDVQAVMAILDFVLDRTAGDPDRVLLTGWSSGGFLVHFIANRYPERFAALCSRGASFTRVVLSEENARKMAARNFPVNIFYNENDLLNSIIESKLAIKWYKSFGIDLEVTVIPKSSLFPAAGHKREPEMAAEFFFRAINRVNEPRIVVSNDYGPAPLALSCSVKLPHQIDEDDLKYFWTLDGKLLSKTHEAFTTISIPGVHKIEVLLTGSDGKTVTTQKQVTVLAPGTKP